MPIEYLAQDNPLRMTFLAGVLTPVGHYEHVINQYLRWHSVSATPLEIKNFKKHLKVFFDAGETSFFWTNVVSNPEVFLECCQSIQDKELSALKAFYEKEVVSYGVSYELEHYCQLLLVIRDYFNSKQVEIDRFKTHYEESGYYGEHRWNSYISDWLTDSNYHWLLDCLSDQKNLDIWEDFHTQFPIYLKASNIDDLRIYFESKISLESVRDWFLLNIDVMSNGITSDVLSKLSPNSPYYYTAQALYLMSLGRHEEALKMMEAELKLFGSKRLFEGSFENFIYGICLFNNRTNPKIYKRMEGFANRRLKGIGQEIVRFICYVGTNRDLRAYESWDCEKDANFKLIYGLVYSYFTSSKLDNSEWSSTLKKSGSAFWRHLFSSASKEKDHLNDLVQTGVFPNIWPAYKVVPEWERVLDRLLKSSTSHQKVSLDEKEGAQERVIYWVDMNDLVVQPRLIKSKDGVRWSKGRAIALSTFVKGNFSDFVTEQDLRVGKTAQEWGYQDYHLSGADTLFALVGCPYVYRMDQPEQEVRVEEEALQLEVKKISNGWKVVTNIPSETATEQIYSSYYYPSKPLRPRIYSGCYCISARDNVIKILNVKSEQAELINTLNAVDEFPSESKEKLTQVVEKLSCHMLVMGDLVANTTQLNKVKGGTDITFQFAPIESDLYKVQALVCPLSESSLTCQPGKGLEHIATQVKGQGVQVKRNLEKEKSNFDSLNDVLRPFDDAKSQDFQWQVDTLGCLKFLESLRDCKNVRIVWPDGVRMKVSYPSVSAGNVHLSLNRIDQWFELAGHVSIDGKTQMAIAELLQKLRQAKGNFIPLDNNEYLAVTDNLRKHLSALDHVVQSSKKTSTLSMYNTGFVEELEKDGANIQADEGWKELSQRIAEAENFQPIVPSTLTAQLRDYQVEGFEWMSRLAKWGAGACLSDDMGLGKTLQTIAMLLSRSAEGPALVVVPTSLVYNWSSELARFAPSLNVRAMKLNDRSELIENAQAGDVVLVTYGVLSSEIELFKQKSWATVVLDEAHVIKNRETKTAKACCALKGDFRVILTGTPIQNNLSEIWSLFEFINPGLLGSFKQFTERFILPIERDKNKDRQRLLKRILTPFILRRTKSEVLEELPQKTEVTIKVSLSEEERALYEHLRLETTTSLDLGEISPIQALAALMKLRQAACHPKLVDPKLNLPSSKCERFLSLVEELKDNHHRALVFSQFTSHLDLIKKELDKRGIEYLYLDGSMSSTERLRLVEAFQKGNQLLFLISLKAGGTGLNLTAADYVIHLDPWWNPAIESQASDRAYRIGQERPVTIYRLIAENTVEERILDLHKTKKTLADSLMEGGDMANQLSKEEILKLLSQL